MNLKKSLWIIHILIMPLIIIIILSSLNREENEEYLEISGRVHMLLGETEYLELLVKTGDNIHDKKTNESSQSGSYRQGYIVRVEGDGFEWGRLERDPKSFAIVRIPKTMWNDSWLEPEYDSDNFILEPDGSKTYKIKTRRAYRFPLENFLTLDEL